MIHADVALLYGHHMVCEIMIMSKHNRYLKVLNARGGSDNPLFYQPSGRPLYKLMFTPAGLQIPVKYQAEDGEKCNGALSDCVQCLCMTAVEKGSVFL